MKAVLQSIAAKTDSGPCVTYVGPDGAGHFVKMVHNGIEYGDMQLIAEAYDLLRKVLGLSAGEIADIFAKWNQGPLNSFLIEITSQVLSVRDPKDGKPLVDHILDKAGQKGTGKWTAQVALDLAVAIPTIAAAIDARVLSSMKDQRLTASQKFKGPSAKYSGSKQELIAAVHDALYASKICSYAQGMSLIQAGSDEYKWNISLKEMARIWKGGCIIRALFLDDIMRAFDKQPKLANLMLDDDFLGRIHSAEAAWRSVVRTALEVGPPPGFDGKRCACGCGKRHKIQNDHIDPVANGGPTCFANLQGLVPKEHVEKTRRDWAAGLLGPMRRRLDGESEDADGPDPPREAGVEEPCRSLNDLRREGVEAVQTGPGPVQLTRA